MKWWYPQSSSIWAGFFHYKPSILGYPHFKHPYLQLTSPAFLRKDVQLTATTGEDRVPETGLAMWWPWNNPVLACDLWSATPPPFFSMFWGLQITSLEGSSARFSGWTAYSSGVHSSLRVCLYLNLLKMIVSACSPWWKHHFKNFVGLFMYRPGRMCTQRWATMKRAEEMPPLQWFSWCFHGFSCSCFHVCFRAFSMVFLWCLSSWNTSCSCFLPRESVGRSVFSWEIPPLFLAKSATADTRLKTVLATVETRVVGCDQAETWEYDRMTYGRVPCNGILMGY